MSIISRYASLVKFSHTLFALPFAFISYVFALVWTGTPFDWLLLVKILLCMVLARNAAMGFNRWADKDIDSKNPRTAAREIPAGKISPKAALVFVIVNSILFMACALWINPLAFYLSPLALLVILSYSTAKRFTSWSHIILGISLSIAPVGAYIAVTGSITLFPLILAAVVVTWVSGFDILYSLQDVNFDKKNSLHSIPVRFSPKGAVVISIVLHLITVYAIWVLGRINMMHGLYWIGCGVFVLLLIVQHILYRPATAEKIGASFGLVNGLSSLAYAAFTICDLLLYS